MRTRTWQTRFGTWGYEVVDRFATPGHAIIRVANKSLSIFTLALELLLLSRMSVWIDRLLRRNDDATRIVATPGGSV